MLRPGRTLRLRPVSVATSETWRLRRDCGSHLLPPAKHLRRPSSHQSSSSQRKHVPVNGRQIPPELQISQGEYLFSRFHSCKTQTTNLAIAHQGCLDDLERLVRHKIWTFTMGCAAVGCVILFSLLFATCFCRSIPSSSSSSRRNSATTTTTDKKQISQTVSKQQMLQIQSNAQHSGKHYR